MDKKILLFLLQGNHINMEQRSADGLWPHKPISMSECIEVIEQYLDKNRFFPYPWVERSQGELIDDVIVIEKLSAHKYVCRFRSASPSDLRVISEQGEKVFNNVKEAIKFYLKWELCLPGDLDGWKVKK
jgi:hypothetical protein